MLKTVEDERESYNLSQKVTLKKESQELSYVNNKTSSDSLEREAILEK